MAWHSALSEEAGINWVTWVSLSLSVFSVFPYLKLSFFVFSIFIVHRFTDLLLVLANGHFPPFLSCKHTFFSSLREETRLPSSHAMPDTTSQVAGLSHSSVFLLQHLSLFLIHPRNMGVNTTNRNIKPVRSTLRPKKTFYRVDFWMTGMLYISIPNWLFVNLPAPCY